MPQRNGQTILDSRTLRFMEYYYSEDSETRGNVLNSCLKAGFSKSTGNNSIFFNRIKKYENMSFEQCLKLFGITKPFLASKLRKVMDLDPAENAKDMLVGARLCLSVMGEATDQQKGTTVYNAPVMIIQGATPEKIRALREGSFVPSPEQLERESLERGEKRLKLLRAGIPLPEANRQKVAKCLTYHIKRGRKCVCGTHEVPDVVTEPVPSLDQHNPEPSGETEPPAG